MRCAECKFCKPNKYGFTELRGDKVVEILECSKIVEHLGINNSIFNSVDKINVHSEFGCEIGEAK